jgi:PAS domain-containing protein
VFVNRALRRIFGSEREEVAGGWRRLHHVELHDFYASLNIIRVITLRRMGLAGHVARVGEMRSSYEILVRKP